MSATPKKKKGATTTSRQKAPELVESRRWVDRMRRWTLVFPIEMIDEVKAEARRSGRTHSRVVVDAVRKHLA